MTKSAKKKKGAPKARSNAQPFDRADRIDPRKKLLARVAGNVAAAIVQAPSPTVSSAEKIADVAVDIAEQILRKAGVIPPAAASPASPVDVPGEAAA